MNYIYTVKHVSTVTTYRKESYGQPTRYPLFFLNFNIGYSIFYTPQNTLFSKIMFYPSFIWSSGHTYIIYYNRES